MNAETTTNNYARRMVLLAGFTAGLADFLFASIKRTMNGGSWMDPWKGVAYGLLGQAARDGGVEMALLGAALHFFICLSGAALLWLLVSRVKFIPRQWFVLGVLYGLAVLVTMNYIVLPLSHIGSRPTPPLPALLNGVIAPLLCVGIPIALITRAFERSAQR